MLSHTPVLGCVESRETAGIRHESLLGLARILRESFGSEFALWERTTAQFVYSEDECLLGLPICASQMPGAGQPPAVLFHDSGVLLLAIPLERHGASLVAVGAFATVEGSRTAVIDEASRILGLDRAEAVAWFARQTVWTEGSLLRLSTVVLRQLATLENVGELQREIEDLSDHLCVSYEEISLLYSVTQNLRISSSDEELGALALKWLMDCVPAQGLAIQFLPVAEQGAVTYKARTSPALVTCGSCPVDEPSFTDIVEQLGLTAAGRPYVANRKVTSGSSWSYPAVRQLIIVPLSESNHVFGWVAAFNHRQDREFGTVEATLLSSVAAILGTHSRNRDLYRQQAEFLASVVRALTSAIDAKDPCTCGHSDRVARIAVRLARELGLDGELLNTIYMAGLLHDIGKIGIDDNVLRKPGRLTFEEFEHIKLHPQLGYKILADIKQLADVLPAVLHHHEQWNGKGYPKGLAGEEIPRIARIVAVADSYDAMTSDRPYRDGMEEKRVEDIFRQGAGKQWDADVIAAYFRARDDVCEIARRERANLTLDVQQWSGSSTGQTAP